jgi:AraC family transcriptional regulator
MDSNKLYQKRINLAIDYLTAHITEPISLEKLAGVSGFSSFYFHRIFTALTGETPADYVLRTRLELAENYLIKTRRSITQIALECGFSNSAVFARTFRQKCGITPSQYRAGLPAQRAQTGERTQPPTEVNFLIKAVTIQEVPPIPAIYVACYEGYDINLICRAWEKLSRWAALHHLDLSQSRAIGLSLDDPHITLRHQCRYYACFSVDPPVAPSSPVNPITIAGGLYAIFRAESPAAELSQVYYTIFHDWLPDSGYQPAHNPPYEVYLQTPEQHPRQWFEVEICIPVEPISI